MRRCWYERDVVEESAAVGFLCGRELVEESVEQYTLRDVVALRGIELLAERGTSGN